MMEQGPNVSSATKASPHVERDTPCARCGYNLRMQPWNGVCPECNTAVLRSGKPVGFRLSSARSERLLRIGIGLLAVAMIIVGVGDVLGVLSMRFYFAMPLEILKAIMHCWVWRTHVAGLLSFVAVLLLTQPFKGTTRPFRPRLALIAMWLGTIGVLGYLTLPFLSWTGAPGRSSPAVFVPLTCAPLCLYTALLLALIHLLLRIERRRQPASWWVACLAVLAGGVLLLSVSYGTAGDVAMQYTFRTAPGVITVPNAMLRLFGYALWCGENVVPACEILILLAVWLVAARLRRAPRVAF